MSMRIAVGAKYLAEASASDAVALARRLGADGVEVDHAHLARAAETPDDAAADLAGLCVAGGLRLVGATLPDLAAVREDDLVEVVSSLCEEIAAASRIGVPAVSFAPAKREALSMEALVRGVQRLAAMGDASYVRVDVTNRLGSRLEQIGDMRRFVASLRHPALRVRIDTGEFQAAAVNPRDVLAEFGGVVGSVVLSDRRGREDVQLGEGHVNLAGVVGDLVRAGYDAWVVVNARGDEGEGLSNPVGYVRNLIARAMGSGS